jgi:hypothetical protein
MQSFCWLILLPSSDSVALPLSQPLAAAAAAAERLQHHPSW